MSTIASIQDIREFYNKKQNPADFQYDLLKAPPLFSLIPQDFDMFVAYDLMTPRYKVPERRDILDRYMKSFGFEFFAAGTNRRAYRHLMSDDFLVKIAIDKAGMQDAPAEWRNALRLKPFCTKIFECSPTGCIGLYERVQPIIYKDQFVSIAEDIFDLLTRFVIGKYVLADIGSNYFMNYGLRRYFGPVLLDYTYMYELDGGKLYCNETIPTPYGRMPCGGLIDYDEGFNHLYCQKCGKRYFASELENKIKNNELEIIGGMKRMGVKLWKNGKLIVNTTSQDPAFKEEQAIPYDPNKGKINNGKLVGQPTGEHVDNGKLVSKQETKINNDKEVSVEPQKVPQKPKYTSPQILAQSKPIISEDVKVQQRSFPANDADGTESIIKFILDIGDDLYSIIQNIDHVKHIINAMIDFSFITRHVKSKDFLLNIVKDQLHKELLKKEKEMRAKAIGDAVVAEVLRKQAEQQQTQQQTQQEVQEEPQIKEYVGTTKAEDLNAKPAEPEIVKSIDEEPESEPEEEEELLTAEDLIDIENAHEEARAEEEEEEELTEEEQDAMKKNSFLNAVQASMVSEEDLKNEVQEQISNTELPSESHGQINLPNDIKMKF